VYHLRSVLLKGSNITVDANFLLNAYGKHLINSTIDLCSLFNGAFCPLPTYNFTGTDSIPISSYINVSGKVPGIAYQVPDLEGYIQLTLIEKGTGTMKACVQATLSNGWSMRQVAVKWVTVGVALLALASALWQSTNPDSLVPYRLLDLVGLYQSIGFSALMSLNYPVAYRSFALNFAWAIGLFYSQSVQTSIDNMRIHTGGVLDSSGGSAVALTNRKLSPYNAIVVSNDVSPSFNSQAYTINTKAFSNISRLNILPPSPVANATVFSVGQVATVTTTPSNILQAGIPIYANTLNISSVNAFMTVFFAVLITAAIAIGVVVVVLLAAEVAVRFGMLRHEQALRLRESLPRAIKSWALRLVSLDFSRFFLIRADKRTDPPRLRPCPRVFLLSVDFKGFVALHPPFGRIILVYLCIHKLLSIFCGPTERLG
jgi:Transient receptor potential (TRP) ion channel/ML-like domain